MVLEACLILEAEHLAFSCTISGELERGMAQFTPCSLMIACVAQGETDRLSVQSPSQTCETGQCS